MRKTLFFILLFWGPLIFAQEGGVIPGDSTGVQEIPEPGETEQVPDTLQVPDAIQAQDAIQVQDEVQVQDAIQVQDEVQVQDEIQIQNQQLVEEQERPLVPYSPDFEFNDGLFASFESVKENRPIPPARIVTDEDLFDRAFYEKITQLKEIVTYDENGVKKVLLTENIWGYSRNGILYINVGSAFHRISFMGSISHFVATVTTYNPNYYDPYYYNPYYSSSYYYNRYSMPQSNVGSTDLRQYLLDFETGDVMEYDTEAVEVLLMKDPELADEFHALSNRKKKQMKFVYIRLYNEKHPLMFPAD